MFTKGFIPRDRIAVELVPEARVLGPEEADIGNAEEEHGDSFYAEAPGPADAVADAGVAEHLLLHYAAAEELEPFALPEDFEFPRGGGEGEVGFDPSDFEGGVLGGGFRVAGGGGGGGADNAGFICGVEDFGDEEFEGAFEVGGEEADFLVVVFTLLGVSVVVEGWVGVFRFDWGAT